MAFDTRALQAYLGCRNILVVSQEDGIDSRRRSPRLHRAGARPVQGVLSRLITRTRISSDREGCRVGVAQLDCARLYSDDDFEPSQRQPSVQFALCGAARCASPVDTQVRLLSKLLRRQHYTLQTTQQSVTIETRRPIVGGRYETY